MVTGANDPFFSFQAYLADGPIGIGVHSAWESGADGSRTRLIDFESGWNLEHEDLPPGIPLLSGINRDAHWYHGTAVLGIIAAVDDNAKGIVGIAPRATIEVTSDELDDMTDVERQIEKTADVIHSATMHLNFGDVLLIERTYRELPAELYDMRIRDSIKEAVKHGIIVVEPAGNAGKDLDQVKDDLGKRIFNTNAPNEFDDSGAIIVGASNAMWSVNEHHHRWADSHGSTNFGTRVDCYAWGERIFTTGSRLRPTLIDAYYDGRDKGYEYFGGTSGASAIIAGVCLLVQNLQLSGLYRPVSGTKGKLGPYSMRQMLRNENNGTLSEHPTDYIGVMPDFKKILANEYIEVIL